MDFAGLHPDAVAFYAELAGDNSKRWWAANRDRYDEHVRGPFEALGAALEPEFGPVKIFRPYRDVRFSADKTPYKLHIGMVTRAPIAHYVQFSDEGLLTGGGVYQVPTPALARFRQIADDARTWGDLEATLDELRELGFEPMRDDELKTAPRGFTAAHPRIHLLRLKRLAVGRSEEAADWMWQPDAAEAIAQRWRAVSLWCEWLQENLEEELAEAASPVRRGRGG
ncbi:DUF2461 domain-containing protein [Microbacterium sp. SORGH_AS_0888]|uniref:DUF2461 domain-containing protein n=1 Tax=Microbacterium sp. SORGH_AS_0888 TaxID=3041791 RepID=UPI002781325F|nr:DUF2461 domain-containing protein [Microbacterium sp. SORGH_AS_0888]MDQ1130120.1 uncharacterized protein (TIGR02453 family) [Microbacterium sp. SORGH_AS_0888]